MLPLCLTAFFLAFARFFMGVSLHDNTWEMDSGKTAHLSDFFYLQYWSPLYYHWFKLLALVCPNPLMRYFLSWGIIAAALALIPVLMKIPRARIYNVIVVILPFLTVNPFLGLFGSAFVLAGFCVVLRRGHTPAYAALAACVTSFIVAFARPEFDYGVFLAAIATLVVLLLTHGRSEDTAPGTNRIGPRTALKYGGLVILLSAVMLLVMMHSRFSRSGIAFAQHFDARAAEHGIVIASPQPWYPAYAVQVFGVHSALPNLGSLSAFDFLRANPRLFARHVVQNLFDLRTLALLACLLPALIWPWLWPRLYPAAAATQRLRIASIYLALTSVPPLLGTLIIYPREHYAIIIAPSLLLFVLQMLPLPDTLRAPAPLAFVAACALIVYVQLRVQPRRDPDRQTERRDLRRIQCVRAADRLFPGQNQTVFDAAALGNSYLDNPRILITPATVTSLSAFQHFAAQSHPLWITADDTLLAQYAVTQPQLDSFLQNTLGYHQQPCLTAANLHVYTR